MSTRLAAWAVLLCCCMCSAAARELLDVRLPAVAADTLDVRLAPSPASHPSHPSQGRPSHPRPQRQHQRRHRRGYCERADPAWRAYLAPAVFEGRVRSVGVGEDRSATLQVRRVMKKEGGWPRRDAVVRLKLEEPPRPEGCTGRFEVPLRNGRNYIVFAERRGHAAYALGPPLKRTRKLVRRVRAVFAPKYPSAARVNPLQSVRVQPGEPVRLECRASARPPPRITWYRDSQPVHQLGIRRIRVQNYRRRSVLVIRHTRREDAARYECRAQGAIGPAASGVANVSVVLPPTETTTWGAPCPMPDPSSYCLNGGTCLFFEQVREPACKCPEGFNGQRCENKDVSSNRSRAGELHTWMFSGK